MAAKQVAATEHEIASTRVERPGATARSAVGRSLLSPLAAMLAAAAIAGCAPVVDIERDSVGGDDDLEEEGSALPTSPSPDRGSIAIIRPVVSRPTCGDTQSNARHCGECGHACLLAQACEKGACVDQPTDCSVTGSCVDESCTEQGRYSVNERIAVDLSKNRRLWQRAYASNLDYGEAVEYCATLVLDGITGWRLPDGEESRSIVLRAGGLKGCPVNDYCAPAIDQAVFPETAVDLYWTTEDYDTGMHLCRSFCDGRSTPYQESDEAVHHVRCVHDPLPMSIHPI